MKKLVLIFAAMLMISLTAVHAQQQQDTISYQSPTKEMVKINAEELPTPVQEALKDTQYSGWESGQIYRTRESDMFLVQIGEGDRAKSYYFDANGRPVGNR